MKNEKSLDIIGQIDSELIDEAENYKEKNKSSIRIKLLAAAACFCLVLALAVCAGVLIKKGSNASIKPSADSGQTTGNHFAAENGAPAAAGNGIYIPAVKMPETSAGEMYDMIGLVVYKGGIYTQAEQYSGDDTLKIDSIVGDYLGYAKGSIDEWSTQADYAEEFASSVPGKVYSVKGYDTNFRICIKDEFEDENGHKQIYIQFFDRLNDIELTVGADLFESRLGLRDRISKIECQSHADWDYNTGNIRNADIEPDIFEAFLDAVDNGYFVNTWDPENNGDSIYDTDAQAHIILTMNDGTVIRLRLIEGGFVGYEPLNWYFVEIPGETFNAVFKACN